MTISRHTALSYLASLLLFWLTFTQLSLGEKYDFIGMSTSGDPISLTGSFFGSDIDLDGTLEHPNGLLEMVNIDTTATLTSNGTLVSVPWSLGDVNSFAFQPVANSGLLTMLAHNETDDMINGNEVHNDSMLEIINGGNVATNMFSAWIDTSVANNSYDGFGSGPILISTQAIAPGPGIKFMYTMNFGEGGSHLDGGTLLGSFTIDDIDDIDDPVDLGDSRFQIRSSETLFVDATGAAMPWEFESGLSVPPTSGGTSRSITPAAAAASHVGVPSRTSLTWLTA